jgi:hypothetical protein
MYKYHVEPLVLSVKEQGSSSEIAGRVAFLLNHFAEQGWEFMRLESVPVTVKPGCLAALTGSPAQVIYLPQLVFRSRV